MPENQVTNCFLSASRTSKRRIAIRYNFVLFYYRRAPKRPKNKLTSANSIRGLNWYSAKRGEYKNGVSFFPSANKKGSNNVLDKPIPRPKSHVAEDGNFDQDVAPAQQRHGYLYEVFGNDIELPSKVCNSLETLEIGLLVLALAISILWIPPK